MKKTELKATKPGLKNSKGFKKKGRGGARPGAGRKRIHDDTQQINIDTPTDYIKGMEEVGVFNKTAYINSLIAIDLKRRGYLQGTFAVQGVRKQK